MASIPDSFMSWFDETPIFIPMVRSSNSPREEEGRDASAPTPRSLDRSMELVDSLSTAYSSDEQIPSSHDSNASTSSSSTSSGSSSSSTQNVSPSVARRRLIITKQPASEFYKDEGKPR